MSSTDTLYLLFLTTGFTVGFGHCIGMCGPIVVSLSLNLKGQPVLVPHLLYHAGRIATYAVLGGLMGATGSFTGVVADIAGIQKAAMIFAGLLIVLMGVGMAGWLPIGRIFAAESNLGGRITRGFQRLTAVKSRGAYFPIGLLLGLLPCGPVYTALIAAARAGMEAESSAAGILDGGLLMTAFGIGTVPALLLVAKLAGMGWMKHRAKIYRAGAVLMIAAGIYFIFKGIRY